MSQESKEKEAPYWIQAAQEVRAESFKEMKKISGAGKEKTTKVDWGEVNAHMIRWWHEKGFRFP